MSLGNDVIVGHRAVLHGCTVQDGALIGIGALVLDDAVVEEGAIVAAGAVVPPGAIIPAGKVAAGVPAKPLRDATVAERAFNERNVKNYQAYSRDFFTLVREI